MTWVSKVLRHSQRYLAKTAGLLVLMALLFSTSCSKPQAVTSSPATATNPDLFSPRPIIKQVETPDLINELTPWLDAYEPQLQIRQPQAEHVFDSTTISVVLRSQDLPIYKDKVWGMGPHVQLFLDNQPYASIYDIEQPIVLKDLTPGTHTIRAFAARPWHESFKNEGAFAQVTFHVFAKTGENSPASDQPLLTYGAPMGTYGAEPVLLDFYLSDTPLHQVAQNNPNISDWQVRYTINGTSFTVKDWQPIYIEGLTPGQNWVQFALIDDQGNPIEGVFNNTVQLLEYEPSLNDGLAKIVRGDLTLEEVGGIVDPTYEPPASPEIPEPTAPSGSEDRVEDNGLEKTMGTAQPELTKPGTNVPEPGQPEEPETSAPETSAPETSAPKTSAPETSAPETGEPETSEPQIVAPEVIESEQTDDTNPSSAPVLSEQDADDSGPKQSPARLFIPDKSAPERLDTADRSEATETETEEMTLKETLVAPSLEPVKPEVAPSSEKDFESVEALVSPTKSVADPRVEAPETEANTAEKITEVGAEAPEDAETEAPEDAEDTEIESPKSDNVTPSKPRYLQRLYDYSDRALKANKRER